MRPEESHSAEKRVFKSQTYFFQVEISYESEGVHFDQMEIPE